MIELQIRDKLNKFLRSEITLHDFNAWLTPATWDIDRSTNMLARDLTYAIELNLAEYSSGHMDEEELRRELQTIADHPTPKVSYGTSATNTSFKRDLGSPMTRILYVGRVSGVGCG